MNRVLVYRGEIPTTRAEVHSCETPVQRVLSLHVTNTTEGILEFTLDVDRGGAVSEVLFEIPVHGSSMLKDSFEWVPGRFLLTRTTPAASGTGLVGDIMGLTASDAGLTYHLSVEVLE